MSYYTGTFLAGARWFWVPFPKLQTFYGLFSVLPVEHSHTKRIILGIFVYLVISKVTTAKVNFRFYKKSNQGATKEQYVLIANKPFLPKMLVSFFRSNISLYIEKNPVGKLCKVLEVELKIYIQAHFSRPKTRFRKNQI